MDQVIHKADTRGYANHGWLESYHSFSFASYYNPQRMQFGTLRVLNDDRVAAGMGFGTHPHQNMEIISIPLKGDLEHKDSIGNTAVIREGDIQVMSAGTGVQHSEYNKNRDREVSFLQIWVLPDKPNVPPRYDQITLDPEQLKNSWFTLLGPGDKHDGLWIHQNAWFHMGEFDHPQTTSYTIKESGNGLYAFVLEGSIRLGDQHLGRRDAFGVWNTTGVTFQIEGNSRILLLEVPMSN